MTPVRTGSRLDQLHALLGRTRHEMASAQRREDRHEANRLQTLEDRIEKEIIAAGGTIERPTPAPSPRTRHRKAEDRVTKRLEQLGVTSHDVKVWGVSVGLLPAVRRGRVKGELVEAYATAVQNGAIR